MTTLFPHQSPRGRPGAIPASWLLGNPLTDSSLQSLLTRAGCLPKYLTIPAPRPGPNVPPFRPFDLTRRFRGLPAALKAPPIHFLPTGHSGFSRAQICTWSLRSPCFPSPASRRRESKVRPPSPGSRSGRLQRVPPRGGARFAAPCSPGACDPRSSDGAFWHPRRI